MLLNDLNDGERMPKWCQNDTRMMWKLCPNVFKWYQNVVDDAQMMLNSAQTMSKWYPQMMWKWRRMMLKDTKIM